MKRVAFIMIMSILGIGLSNSASAQAASNNSDATIFVVDNATGYTHTLSVKYNNTAREVAYMLVSRGVNITGKILMHNNILYLFDYTTMGQLLLNGCVPYFNLADDKYNLWSEIYPTLPPYLEKEIVPSIK